MLIKCPYPATMSRAAADFEIDLFHPLRWRGLGPSHTSMLVSGAKFGDTSKRPPPRPSRRWRPSYAIMRLCRAIRASGWAAGVGGRPLGRQLGAMRPEGPSLSVPRGVKHLYSFLCTHAWGAHARGGRDRGRGRLCCASSCAPCNPPCNHALVLQPPRSKAQTRMVDVSRAWGALGLRWGRC